MLRAGTPREFHAHGDRSARTRRSPMYFPWRLPMNEEKVELFRALEVSEVSERAQHTLDQVTSCSDDVM